MGMDAWGKLTQRTSGESKLEELYDKTIVPMLIEMDSEEHGYFCLGAFLVMLSVYRAVIEGEDVLQVMDDIETEAMKCAREDLATRALMLGVFMDKVMAKQAKPVQ
jgi:hypothetical protein